MDNETEKKMKGGEAAGDKPTRTEVLLIIESPMEFYSQRIVGDIYHALHEKVWYKAVTSFEVGGRGFLKEAKSIAAEMYSEPGNAAVQLNVGNLAERVAYLERTLAERTDAFFQVWAECERLKREQRGGV